MPLKKIHTCLIAAAIAAALLPAGCKVVNPPAANSSNSETVVYQQWEAETHRPHVELTQRNKDEQKEYSDWRQQHPDHH